MIILLIWVAVVITALTLYCRKAYSKFTPYGVKNPKPWPIIGNLGSIIFRKEHFVDYYINFYKAHPKEKFVGRYEFFNPVVTLHDLDLVKKVVVKDFEHFQDHRSLFNDKESLLARNLVSLKGEEWKEMRSSLSPAFTSSKIRLMVPFMVEVGDQMTANLKEKIKSSGADYIDIESKDLTSRYANDVIATCAFGLKVDSQVEENNQFLKMGKDFTNMSIRKVLTIVLSIVMPKLVDFFKMDILSKDANKFFRSLVLGTMKDRERNNIIRHDMIHLLMEAKKGHLTHDNIKSNEDNTGFAAVEESLIETKTVNREWTDTDLIAQAVIFFIAGFETVSTAMTFLLYELARNPEVQEKLVQEIQEQNAKNNGNIDFKSIEQMQYLDMVVSESLRIWPPGVGLERVCTKDYNLGRPNDKASKDFVVRKDTTLTIPVIAFHRDPQYFENPDKFDPERFSEENKHKINTNAYMPFGIGPRNCIASRFALCEVKVLVYQLLQHFEVSPCEKTCIPPVLDMNAANMALKGGHWLKLKIRP